MGLDIDEKHFYTSALATASLWPTKPGPGPLSSGSPVCSTPSTKQGITIDETDPRLRHRRGVPELHLRQHLPGGPVREQRGPPHWHQHHDLTAPRVEARSPPAGP